MSSREDDPRGDAELRDALAVIDSSLFVLRRRFAGDSHVLRHLDRIAAHVKRASALVRERGGDS